LAQINFHGQDIALPEINFTQIKAWLKAIGKIEEVSIKRLNYIFCSDDFLLEINRTHLQHDYYTDIITFDLSETEAIESDIYISLDRVKDNANTFNSNTQTELLRVIAHGFLHLIGYNDKNEDEQIIMRNKEDACLSLWLDN
jgi:rRNA maturation RNase YbeY